MRPVWCVLTFRIDQTTHSPQFLWFAHRVHSIFRMLNNVFNENIDLHICHSIELNVRAIWCARFVRYDTNKNINQSFDQLRGKWIDLILSMCPDERQQQHNVRKFIKKNAMISDSQLRCKTKHKNISYINDDIFLFFYCIYAIDFLNVNVC